MTAIAAFTDGQTIVLGGDSAGASRNELRLRADPKVFLRGSYAIGFTTSFRMGQILRWGVDLPEPPAGASAEELERFLVTELVDVVTPPHRRRACSRSLCSSSSRLRMRSSTPLSVGS